MAEKWCENLSVFLLPKWLLTKLLSKAISWIVESSFTSYGTGVIIAGISGIITHMRILHRDYFFFFLSKFSFIEHSRITGQHAKGKVICKSSLLLQKLLNISWAITAEY